MKVSTRSAGDESGVDVAVQFREPAMIIVFDAQCLLCNGWVKFLLKHDRRGVFRQIVVAGRGE